MNFCVLANKVTWAVREGREKKEKPTLALASSLADQSKLNYLNVFGACIFWYSFLSHYGTHLLFPEGTVSLFSFSSFSFSPHLLLCFFFINVMGEPAEKSLWLASEAGHTDTVLSLLRGPSRDSMLNWANWVSHPNSPSRCLPRRSC